MAINSKHKHLEFIQFVINRMANNSFHLKGWTITMVAASFALFAKEERQGYVLIAYFSVVIFWIIDSYFLSQERLYCNLYDHVRKLDEKRIDFSMDTRKHKRNKRNNWVCSMFSLTLVWFYPSMIAIMLVIRYLSSKFSL